MKTLAVAAFCAIAPLAIAAAPRAPKLAWSALQQTPAPQPQGNSNPSSPDALATPVKTDPAVEASIRHMFEVADMKTAIQDTLAKSAENVRGTLRTALPPGAYRETLIDLFFAKFQSKFTPDKLIDICVPIYAKYCSKEEIDRLSVFYSTPLGKKSLSVTQKATFEIQLISMKQGELWGRESMMEVLAEHPDLAKALEAASAGPKN